MKNTLDLLAFAEYLRRSDVSERFAMADFYEMDLMKGIFILVKAQDLQKIFPFLAHSKLLVDCIHSLFANTLSCFHQSISLCREIFCTSSCLLNLDLLPYCWKPFKFQEVLISCKTIRKTFGRRVFKIFVRVAANQRHTVFKRNRWKTTECIVTGVYLHVTLFRKHAKDKAAEKESDTAMQMTLEHA